MASTSRLPIEEPWEAFKEISPFPISNVRSLEHRLARSSAPQSIPFKPQGLTPSRGNSAASSTTSKYSYTISLRVERETGVWSNGTDTILSASCSDVQAFLTSARHEMALPPAPSEVVFSLAALSVFYSVEDPVHWMFWSDDKKSSTAEVVNRIARAYSHLYSFGTLTQ